VLDGAVLDWLGEESNWLVTNGGASSR
jgi:hypothetical protein